MAARYSGRSTLPRSSRATNSRIAACSLERGVPPSPNIRQAYQTDVRLSSINLRPPPLHAKLNSTQTPPPHPLPSPFRHHLNPRSTPFSQSPFWPFFTQNITSPEP